MKTLKTKALFLGMCSVLVSPVALAWDHVVYDVHQKSQVPFADFVARLASRPDQVIALGEKHNTAAVQNAQAEVIRGVHKSLNDQGMGVASSSVSWEFLDYKDHETNDRLYGYCVAGSITPFEMLATSFGSDQYSTYVPVVQAAKDLGSLFVSINLSRKEKAPVVQGGIAAADPALVPPGFALGSASYLARFGEAMQGHSTPQQIDNYFAAQSLTDDVMAFHMADLPADSLRFLVAGSFHTDYKDGVVARLQARLPGQAIQTVRLFDASDYASEQDLLTDLPNLLQDPKYGEIADFLIFVNEPGVAP